MNNQDMQVELLNKNVAELQAYTTLLERHIETLNYELVEKRFVTMMVKAKDKVAEAQGASKKEEQNEHRN